MPGVFLIFLIGLAACGAPRPLGAVGTIHEGFRIGLLLPEKGESRYEKYDRPYITRALAALCPRCEVVYANAGRDHVRQERQMDAMLAEGIKVFILGAVDVNAIASAVARAKFHGAKVVAYDRLANGPIDAYVSYDDRQIGRMQGQALLDAIRARGDLRRGAIVMINGSPVNRASADVKAGAHAVLDGQVIIGREYDIPSRSPETAAAAAANAFAVLGAQKVVGVYVADDRMAAGVAAIMVRARLRPGTPLTGEGAEAAAVQRILDGAQTMTVYKPVAPEAGNAARLAVDLGAGRTVYGTATVVNGTTVAIPAMITSPVVVTSANVIATVVKDGLLAPAEAVRRPAGPVRPAKPVVEATH
ncbi:substrate-binding domain-containing protein [Planotetraspora phitsanulokensis]|uniref:substrate-binding domain-containing protein n=1 Tax=Planotetraspora phitsanulokensis TaxID=575192 RepID=UPI001EF1D375|nr:substrate-binding domain-containing protein [Planotetraspora phitsanulokensis]